MPRELPSPKEIRDLLEELLGRTISVTLANPIRLKDLPRTLVSMYIDDNRKLLAVVGMDFDLTVYAAAAIGLVPPAGAQACIEDRQITPMLGENATEVCNVLATLLNQAGQPHLRMADTYLPGQTAPIQVTNYLMALGRRTDQIVEISGYGGGRLTVALAG